jgi:hypothetical protein
VAEIASSRYALFAMTTSAANICTKLRPVSADTLGKPLIYIMFSGNASWGFIGRCPQTPFFPVGVGRRLRRRAEIFLYFKVLPLWATAHI